MPWTRNDSDPLEIKRRKLAEQERLLFEKMSQLTEELQKSGEAVPDIAKPAEPPVWRLEDDLPPRRATDSNSARKRNLARQRQRDMILFFVFIIVLVIVLGLVLWFASAHHSE